jgi:cupin 2 domain-containing protein
MMPSNLFTSIPAHLRSELAEVVLQSPNIRIERIVSQGHASPEGFWYDLADDEWVLLVQGAARLRFDNGFVEMSEGDYLHIPAHQRHRVEWTDPDQQTIWIAVYYSSVRTD